MTTEIKCEIMTVWDFEHCADCRRFRARSGKGLNNWGCTLNSETPQEKRDFGMIWDAAYLQDNGYKTSIPEVVIIPVSKRKKVIQKNKKALEATHGTNTHRKN